MDTTSQGINKEPLVSILMLTHNRAQYISTAIEGVLAQTYQNFELVIIDDGSTDETEGVLSKYDDPRICIISYPENKGLHVRRAESLAYAQGAYTAIIDSDDVWTDATKLEAQVAYMQQYDDCCVVGTFITLINAQGADIGENHYAVTDQGIRNSILKRNQFTHSSVLMRTSALSKTLGYRDTKLAEDLDLFLQLGIHGTFGNIPKYMTSYRIHTKSFNPQRTAMAKAVLGIIKKYKHQYPGYYTAIVKAYIRILITRIYSSSESSTKY